MAVHCPPPRLKQNNFRRLERGHRRSTPRLQCSCEVRSGLLCQKSSLFRCPARRQRWLLPTMGSLMELVPALLASGPQGRQRSAKRQAHGHLPLLGTKQQVAHPNATSTSSRWFSDLQPIEGGLGDAVGRGLADAGRTLQALLRPNVSATTPAAAQRLPRLPRRCALDAPSLQEHAAPIASGGLHKAQGKAHSIFERHLLLAPSCPTFRARALWSTTPSCSTF